MLVIPAFLIAYLTMFQCKSVDGLTNLAVMFPWHVYVLSYLVISLVAFWFNLVETKKA